MGVSVLSCLVEIIHVQYARQGVGEKIWGVSVISCHVEIVHAQYARHGVGENIWVVSVLWRPT